MADERLPSQPKFIDREIVEPRRQPILARCPKPFFPFFTEACPLIQGASSHATRATLTSLAYWLYASLFFITRTLFGDYMM